MEEPTIAIDADSIPPRAVPSVYPEPFASQMKGREKRSISGVFGLSNITVNLTKLAPGAVSALRHSHARQDECIYVLQGYPTLHTDKGLTQLAPGMCAGFKAGSGDAHRIVNTTKDEVIYIEAGDNTPGDHVTYPDDDIAAVLVDGQWQFHHKDGRKYE